VLLFEKRGDRLLHRRFITGAHFVPLYGRPRLRAVRLALAGDTMLGRGVAELIETEGPNSLFAPELVAAVHEADLCVLNLECCISERGAPAPGKVFGRRQRPPRRSPASASTA
jgi:hypothetical protein